MRTGKRPRIKNVVTTQGSTKHVIQHVPNRKEDLNKRKNTKFAKVKAAIAKDLKDLEL